MLTTMNLYRHSSVERLEDVTIADSETTKRWFDAGKREMNLKKTRKFVSYNRVSGTSSSSSGLLNDDSGGSTIDLENQGPHLEIHYSDLRVLSSLGEGVSSYVKKVLHIPSGEIMAIKVLKPIREKDWMSYLCRELTIMRFSYSPYFLDFYGATVCDGTRVVMLMEYMDLGSLESVRLHFGGTLAEPILGKITKPILNGLFYLHHHFNILHRDIKPANILLNSKGDVKLSDFGVSHYMDELGKVHKNVLGTRDFMSPECMSGEVYGEPSDIWSLGITLYYCAVGKLPYKLGPSYGYWELFFSIRNEEIPPLPPEFSEEFRDFVLQCLERDVNKRATIPVLLSHPFIQKHKDVDLVEMLQEMVNQAVDQLTVDLAAVNDEPIIDVLREKKDESVDDDSFDDVTTPVSFLDHDNSFSLVEIPQLDPLPPISYPTRTENVIIPQVVLNVYQKMLETREDRLVRSPSTSLHVSTSEEETIESSKTSESSHQPQLPEEVTIQNVVLMPPTTTPLSSTVRHLELNNLTMEKYLMQVDNWEGKVSPADHSSHASEGNLSVCNIADSIRSGEEGIDLEENVLNVSSMDTPRIVNTIVTQEEELDANQENTVNSSKVTPYLPLPIPYQANHIIITDTFMDEMSMEEEQVHSVGMNPIRTVSDVEDSLFMCPKLSSERKLLYRMNRPRPSWKQRFIRAWNRVIRRIFRKNGSTKTSRRGCWKS